jgi:hypothetical protein
VRLAQRAGERRLEAEARARRGGLLLDLVRPLLAESQMRDAKLIAAESEDRRGETLSGIWLGHLLWEADDAGARASLERATTLAHEIGFYRAESVGLAILARVHRAAGDLAAADETSARAMELAGRHGAEIADRTTIAGTRVLVLRTLGREREAELVLRELERSVRHANRAIKDAPMRRAQRDYLRRLADAVLSVDGPVYPRQ